MQDIHIRKNVPLFNLYEMKTSIDHVKNECNKKYKSHRFFSSEEIKAGRMREMIMFRGHKITGKNKKVMNNKYFVSRCARLYIKYFAGKKTLFT